MLFGFDITDNIAPVIQRIALYNLSTSVYEQTPQTFTVKKNGTVTDTIVINASHIGIGLQTDDYMNSSENTLTYYKATIIIDNNPLGTITLDDIGYDVTRYQHAYIDYKSKKQNGQMIQLMFQLNGNLLNNIYNWKQSNKGIINITDGKAHHIEITLLDAMNNSSSVLFNIRAIGDSTLTHCTSLFKPNQANVFQLPNVSVKLNEKALYDDICFSYATIVDATSLSNRHRIHYNYVPSHTYFDLSIKPNRAIAFNMKDKVAMVYNDGKEENGKEATADGVWYKASVRNFGEYRLVLDETPPEIKSVIKNNAILSKAARINFIAKDQITSVKRFKGEIDGKWVCFEQHGDNFFYTFDEHCQKGKHKLVFTATDENGNSKTIQLQFTR